MKITRPTKEDIESLYEVAKILDDLPLFFLEYEDSEQWRTVLGKLIDATKNASLFRIAICMETLVDPKRELLDQNADTLELHPKIVNALAVARDTDG